MENKKINQSYEVITDAPQMECVDIEPKDLNQAEQPIGTIANIERLNNLKKETPAIRDLCIAKMFEKFDYTKLIIQAEVNGKKITNEVELYFETNSVLLKGFLYKKNLFGRHNFQGLGVGSDALKLTEEYLLNNSRFKHQDAIQIRLIADPDPNVGKFYEKNGFKITGMKGEQPIMTKTLTSQK
jgi:GNAT superfamily N-acetyltransferase